MPRLIQTDHTNKEESSLIAISPLPHPTFPPFAFGKHLSYKAEAPKVRTTAPQSHFSILANKIARKALLVQVHTFSIYEPENTFLTYIPTVTYFRLCG